MTPSRTYHPLAATRWTWPEPVPSSLSWRYSSSAACLHNRRLLARWRPSQPITQTTSTPSLELVRGTLAPSLALTLALTLALALTGA